MSNFYNKYKSLFEVQGQSNNLNNILFSNRKKYLIPQVPETIKNYQVSSQQADDEKQDLRFIIGNLKNGRKNINKNTLDFDNQINNKNVATSSRNNNLDKKIFNNNLSPLAFSQNEILKKSEIQYIFNYKFNNNESNQNQYQKKIRFPVIQPQKINPSLVVKLPQIHNNSRDQRYPEESQQLEQTSEFVSFNYKQSVPTKVTYQRARKRRQEAQNRMKARKDTLRRILAFS